MAINKNKFLLEDIVIINKPKIKNASGNFTLESVNANTAIVIDVKVKNSMF